MEFILVGIVVLFIVILAVLALLEIDLAWAAGIAATITVILCVMAAVQFGVPRLAPTEVVRTTNLAPLVAGLAVFVALLYGIRRMVIARRARKAKQDALV